MPELEDTMEFSKYLDKYNAIAYCLFIPRTYSQLSTVSW